MNRILHAIALKEAEIKTRLADGLTTKAGVKSAGKELDMDFLEFVRFQELKSIAVAQGILTTDEGMTIYALLGNTPTVFNRQPVATKAVLTGLFGELLEARLADAS